MLRRAKTNSDLVEEIFITSIPFLILKEMFSMDKNNTLTVLMLQIILQFMVDMLQDVCVLTAVMRAFHHFNHLCVMTHLSISLKQDPLLVILDIQQNGWVQITDKHSRRASLCSFSPATAEDHRSAILTMSSLKLMETNSDKQLLWCQANHSHAVGLCHNN